MTALELTAPLTAARITGQTLAPDLAAYDGHVSLANIKRVDSAGAAQLAEWQAGFGRPLTLHHAPPELARLITLYGLSGELICDAGK